MLGCLQKGTSRDRALSQRWVKREIIPNATLSPPQGLLHYKVGSDESPFSVSLTVRDKVTRQHPEKHNF